MDQNFDNLQSKINTIHGVVVEKLVELYELGQEEEEEIVDRDNIIDKLIEALTFHKGSGGCDDEQPSKMVKCKNKDETSATTTLNNIFSISPEKRALRNPLILTEVLKYVDTSNLKNCRVVSSAWNELSTGRLSKEKCLEITLEFDQKYNAYFVIKKPGHKYTATTLETINDRIEELANKKNFPCKNFYFGTGIHRTNGFSKFLALYGEEIKGLKLKFDYKATTQQLLAFRELLFMEAPNVESLYLVNISSNWTTGLWEDSSFGMTLPNLKFLNLNRSISSSHIKFFNQLLNAAVNLEEILDGSSPDKLLSSHVAKAVVEAKKTHLVKAVQLPISVADLSMYELFASSQLKLETLQVETAYSTVTGSTDEKSRLARALSAIFQSSSRTLSKLTIEFLTGRVHADFILPIVPALRTLVLKWEECQTYWLPSILPNNLRLSSSFPTLKRLTLDFGRHWNSRDATWDTFSRVFPFLDLVPTVKYLDIVQLPDPDWLELLAPMFPNLRGLMVREIIEFPPIGKKIWTHFQNVRILKLEIRCGRVCNRFPQLEACMTGFYPSTCAKLKEDPESVPNFERLRKNPSIVNMKRLKNLDITFCDINYPDYQLLSHVTGRFCFKLMPRLSAKVIAKKCDYLQSALATLAPYAEIIL